MNPPTPERKKCSNPDCDDGKIVGNGFLEICPTCKGTGLKHTRFETGEVLSKIEPCPICTPQSVDPRTDALLKLMCKSPPLVSAEPVSEKHVLSGRLVLKLYQMGNLHHPDFDQLQKTGKDWWNAFAEELESRVTDHIRETVYRDEVKPLRGLADNLAVQLKTALKALPNPDHDEPRFTGKRWFHASERTDIEQALDKYHAFLAAYQTTQKEEK